MQFKVLFYSSIRASRMDKATARDTIETGSIPEIL